MSKRIHLLSVFAVLFLASLACQINAGGPDIPELPEAENASPEEITENWTAAFEKAAETGEVTVVITEAQLTAFARERVAEDEDPILEHPVILLRDGTMQIYGTSQNGNVTANVLIVVSVGVDEEGGPKLEVTSADWGPIEVSEDQLTTFTALINETLTGQLGSTATGFTLQGILISDGIMAITGTVR